MRSPQQRETIGLLNRMKSFLKYDPLSGDIVFTDTRYGAVELGQVVGFVGADGYKRFSHRGEMYMTHRVAWALYYNKWPEYTIDHINRDSKDNRISNLADVPQHVNNRNKPRHYKKKTTPSSGNKG